MRTRTVIGIFTVVALVGANYEHNQAAMYIALAWGALSYQIHAVEVKVNKLLDRAGITVWDSDIAKE